MRKLKPFTGINKGNLKIVLANKEYEVASESSVFVDENVVQNTPMGNTTSTRRIKKTCYKIIAEDNGVIYYAVDMIGQQYELAE